MTFRDFNNKYAYLAIVVTVLMIAFLPPSTVSKEGVADVVLTPYAREHILYGNNSGGGHLYGVGEPCKSEFPQSWDSEDIVSVVTQQAANDNLKWTQQNNGYYVSEKMHGDVRVRLVLSDDRSRIITAYPVNQPRNPCNIK